MLRSLVMLPTYDEAANLEAIVEAILRENAGTSDTDVLVIDDNSPDDTGRLAEMLHARHPTRVHVLHWAAKEGLGRAYAAGHAWALASNYDVVVQKSVSAPSAYHLPGAFDDHRRASRGACASPDVIIGRHICAEMAPPGAA